MTSAPEHAPTTPLTHAQKRITLFNFIVANCIQIRGHDNPFRLAGGQTSRVKFDLDAVSHNPTMLRHAAELLLKQVAPATRMSVINIVGPNDGAGPLLQTLSDILFKQTGRPTKPFMVNVKDNDKRGRLLTPTGETMTGDFPPAAFTLLADDVTTRGTSLIKAYRKGGHNIGTVLAFLSILDRQDGATTNLQEAIANSPHYFIFALSEFDDAVAQAIQAFDTAQKGQPVECH